MLLCRPSRRDIENLKSLRDRVGKIQSKMDITDFHMTEIWVMAETTPQTFGLKHYRNSVEFRCDSGTGCIL